MGLSGDLTRPRPAPPPPGPCARALCWSASARGRWQPHLGLPHALHGLGMLLRAGAEHLRIAGRCEGPGTPEVGLTIVRGASQGRRSTEGSGRKARLALCWFVFSPVSAPCCVCPPFVCLSFLMFSVCVSVSVAFCLSVFVCLSVTPSFQACCQPACVSSPPCACAGDMGQICLFPVIVTSAGGGSVSPVEGSSGGPPGHPPGRGPWSLRGKGPCTRLPRRAAPPAGGAGC